MSDCFNSMITISGPTERVSKLVSGNFEFIRFAPDSRIEPEHHYYHGWRMKQWGCIALEELEIAVVSNDNDEMEILVAFRTPSPALKLVKHLRDSGLRFEGTYEEPQAYARRYGHV